MDRGRGPREGAEGVGRVKGPREWAEGRGEGEGRGRGPREGAEGRATEGVKRAGTFHVQGVYGNATLVEA